MISEQNVFSVYVYVKGVKVRCRKPDRHQLEVGKFPIETDESGTVTNLEAIKSEALPKARALVTKMMKTCLTTPHVTFNFTTLESHDGYQIIKAQLFDDRNFNIVLESESEEVAS